MTYQRSIMMNEDLDITGLNGRIIDVVKTDFPKFHITEKNKVWHQVALGYLMFWMWRWPKNENGKRKWSSTFMTEFTTTMGYGMYVTDISILTRRRYWWTIAHEFVHISDMEKYGSIPYSIAYLFPQCLVLLAPLAIGTIWFPSMIWFLAFLVFGLPWPSPGRSHLEWRGYTMTLACRYWETGGIGIEHLPMIINSFTGSDYYFMWPFRRSITAKFQESLRKITSGEILEDEVFRKIHDAYHVSLNN